MDISGLLSFLAGYATLAAIYAVLAVGLNVQWGYTGLFNIGIAGFFAVGAYTSALVTLAPPEGPLAEYVRQAFALNQPFLVGVVAGGLVSAAMGLLIGLVVLRLREDYLAIATLGIAESVRLILNNERWLANGPQGLVGLPRPLGEVIPPEVYQFFYLGVVATALVAVLWAAERVLRAPWGRVLRAVRDDELLASTSGKDSALFKLQAMGVGSFIMGVGGALYAHSVGAIQPSTFEPLFGTFLVWVMLTLGGRGNTWGAVLGSFAVWGIWSGTEFLTDRLLPVAWSARAPFIRTLLIGLLLAVLLSWRPLGLLPEPRVVSRFLPPFALRGPAPEGQEAVPSRGEKTE